MDTLAERKQPAPSMEADASPSVSKARLHAARPRLGAILLGLSLVPFLCWWSMRTEIIAGGSELIEASLVMIAVFVLFLLVLVNGRLRRWRPGLALTRLELLFVYVMQTTSLGLAGLGQMQFLNQALGGAFYYATPENKWATFQPYIPRWWVPDTAVLDAYYKGNSTFFTVLNLRGWAVPILSWTVFIFLMLCCFLCLNTMLRRHWVEHERLTFPLTALPLELTNDMTTRSLLQHRGFWGAFLAVCALRSISGFHHLYPSFPEPLAVMQKGQLFNIGSYLTTSPWDAVGYFVLGFHPLIIGITYFLPLEVGFSAWFFYLMTKGEDVLAAVLGYRSAGASAASQNIPYTGEQGAGAFVAIALFSLWGARHHLRNVVQKAIGRAPGVRDSDEPLSYRVAFFGFLASFSALTLYVALGGMSWYLAALFFALYLLMIVTVTRLRAEAGPMLNYGPDLNPHRAMTLIPGTHPWNARDLTVFSYLQWFDSDYRTVAMPQQMEAMKLSEAVGFSLRALSKWMLLAGLIAAVASFVSVLALYYHYGATLPSGDNGWRIYNGKFPFQTLMNWLDNPTQADPVRVQWVGVGFLATAALIFGRARFFWWPFHPAGFAMAHAGYTMPWVWFATFLGWLFKSLILRYGGMRLYRLGIPLFLGLILGDIVISGIWSLIGIALGVDTYMFFPG